MRIAYLDESGTPDLGANTSHFVLLALSIDGSTWKSKDRDITRIKRDFNIERAEIHAGWLARRYVEQERISGFASLNHSQRRQAVRRRREQMLMRRAALHGVGSVESLRRQFRESEDYIHLTFDERRDSLKQIAQTVAGWQDCQIFAECTDKRTFRNVAPPTPPFEEAFTQVVTRFHRYLSDQEPPEYGMLVQDYNPTVASRLTTLMRTFHQRGTRWTGEIPLLIETPLFVDSRLTSLVQVADVCAYGMRRYLERNEAQIFDLILPRILSSGDGRLVGARHYRGTRPCPCQLCARH